MKKYFIRLVITFSILSVAFPFEGNCMHQVDEELDYSGPSLLMRRGQRVTDLQTNLPNALTIGVLCGELQREDLSKVTRLNLSKNYIGDNGIPAIVNFVKNNMPNLKVLDLSFNRISENGIKPFAPLLINDEFKYLNIVGTGGASSIDGIRNLITELESNTPLSRGTYEHNQEISSYISKVIWLPEGWLDGENTKKNVPQSHIKSHKRYYKQYK